MARPKAEPLTVRELEVMQAFWRVGEATVADVRDELARSGRELAYTTVATLVRILSEKRYLKQTTAERPFRYRPCKSFEEVSTGLVRDLVERVFRGSREQLLLQLFDKQNLTSRERQLLQQVLQEGDEGAEDESDERGRAS